MHIHILGICGSFMGGLAALARAAGHRVTGCDSGVYPPMSDQLRALGIDLIEGFGADQLALAPDVFVVGNVVSRARLADGTPKFPLMEAILDAGARYTSGPQWLSEQVLAGRHVLAVAGTHGKTTTTSMLAWILECAGLEPGFLVGGVPLNFGVSARLGNMAPALAPLGRPGGGPGPSFCVGAPFVIEADEYDTAFFDKRSKFVHYRPRTAVLNNLEFDHADIFDDLAAIERQFQHLLRTVPASGCVVVNGLEESLARVLNAGCWSEVASFGGAVSDWSARGEPGAFDVLLRGQVVARVAWPLTGVHNRRHFDTKLLECFQTSQRTGRGFAVLLLDADHFKQVNDTHGHPAGDAVLQQLAHLLDENTRAVDFVARYGGEEFAVLLPHTPGGEGSMAVAEKIRAAIAAADFPEIGHMTVSIGASVWNPTDTHAHAIVERADKALYQAKGAGRNLAMAS